MPLAAYYAMSSNQLVTVQAALSTELNSSPWSSFAAAANYPSTWILRLR